MIVFVFLNFTFACKCIRHYKEQHLSIWTFKILREVLKLLDTVQRSFRFTN